jgi:hypothetical protein
MTYFTVSFTPVEYGKERIGKLIIQTESKFFSYVVKGTFPAYIPPSPDKGKVIDGAGINRSLLALQTGGHTSGQKDNNSTALERL